MDVDNSIEEGSSFGATILLDQPSSSSLKLQDVTLPCSSEEEIGDSSSSSDDGEEEEEEGDEEGDDDMRTQVKEFFAELKVEEGKQRKRLMKEGMRIPRRKSLLPPHLHSVMGNANLRLARGDTGAAIELCMEVVRQGMPTKLSVYRSLSISLSAGHSH